MRRKDLVMFVVGGMIVALGLAFLVAPYASTSPDGLNKVAVDEGFDDEAREPALADGPLAGYGVKGAEDDRLSRGLSGVIGVVISFGIGLILFALLGALRSRRPDPRAGPATG